MRRTILLTACLLAGGVASGATVASAAPSGRGRAPATRTITLAAYPNPGVAGEPALVAGRVFAAGAVDVEVTLWMRPPGAARATLLAQVSADANGAFVFTRASAPLDESASLYATALGLRSRPVREQVAASVMLGAPDATVTSGSAVALTGRVLPTGHAGEPVLVQQRSPSGWQTIARAVVGADGGFVAASTFSGAHAVALRAFFGGDAHNLPGVSDPLELLAEPATNGQLSLAASSEALTLGQPVTLSGALAGSGGRAAGVPVTLLAGPDVADVQPIASTTTDGAGNFRFAQTPGANTVYAVTAGAVRSAPLVVGTQLTVTPAASTLSASLGSSQTIEGSVDGAAPGSDVALQLLGDDGAFHTIARVRLAIPVGGASSGGSFAFMTTLVDPGSKTYRVLAAGDATHESGLSGPLTVVVSPRPASLVAAALGQA